MIDSLAGWRCEASEDQGDHWPVVLTAWDSGGFAIERRVVCMCAAIPQELTGFVLRSTRIASGSTIPHFASPAHQPVEKARGPRRKREPLKSNHRGTGGTTSNASHHSSTK